MFRQASIVVLGLLATTSALAAATDRVGETVFEETFEEATKVDARLQWDTRKWQWAHGYLRSVDGHLSMCTFDIGGLALADWRLSFEVKRFLVPEKDQHFGVVFTYADGTSLRIYCRGKAVYWLDKAGDKTRASRRLGEALSKPMPSGDTAPWTPFLIATRGAYVHVDVDVRRVGVVRREPAQLRSARFYAYNVDCGFDDIRFESLLPASARDAQPAVPELALHASFEGTTVIRGTDGEADARTAKGLTFTDGVFGQAVRVSAADGAKPLLEYDARDAFMGAGGTVMFWFRPEWDGVIRDPDRFPFYGLFWTGDEHDKSPMRIWQWHWLRADLSPGEGGKSFSLRNRCRGTWLKGDWHHVALVWNEDGWCTLYADGVPYERGLTAERYLPQRQQAAVDGTRAFGLGALPGSGGRMKVAGGAYDELRIYRTPLSGEQVVAEVHGAFPVDLIVERRFVRAGSAGKLTLALYPGGRMVVPAVGKEVATPVDVGLQARLLPDGTDEPVAETTFNEQVDDEVLLPMGIPPLTPGDYRLTCTVTHGQASVRRSFRIVAYELSPGSPPTPDGLRVGEPTQVVDCADDASEAKVLSSAATTTGTLGGIAYREAGAEKADRFGFEIEFPEAQCQGAPVLLEILWPDDKPRSMGLYMYPEAESRQHRDRLAGGIQSGDEYPVSGEMRTTRYLFYPDRRRYLFEARTMVPGMPAAVASVTARPLAAPLPRLALRTPEKLPHRKLGHMDEDASFEILFGRHPQSDQAVRYLETLCDYFDYTGQELISYPLLRYHSIFYPVSGTYPGGGLRPEGWIDLFLQVLGARGKQLIGTVNLYTLPELYLLPNRLDALIDEGLFTRDAQGDLVSGQFGYLPNPAHPVVRTAFLKHVNEILRRYGPDQAFGGIDLWRTPAWSFASLNHGYDDTTVAQFEAETGTSVPDGKGRERFRARHRFLTGPALETWLAWRARKTTDLIAEIDRRATALRPDLPVFLSLPVAPWTQGDATPDLPSHYYRDFGIDVNALRGLPSVVLAPQRHPTDYRHKKHWDNSESRRDELSFDRANSATFRAPGRATSASYLRYFESFNDSLKPDVYSSYFQNADVKPHGRFFLKDFAFCLATMDTTRMLIGAQPLGTAGRDEVTREFARAYCALPAVGFEDAEGPSDPVAVRYCTTDEGIYVYAVNALCFPARATCRFSRNSEGIDLATGAVIRLANRNLAIDLAPFQLRSFRFRRPLLFQAKRPRVETAVSEDIAAWFADRIAAVEAGVRVVGEAGADVTALALHVAAAKSACAEGAYAEAHRLLFAKKVMELEKLREAAAHGYLAEQTQMMARGSYAVNCGKGGSAFYRAASGTLFFPDQPFEEGGYGYVGSYRSVTRPVGGLTDTSDPTLYATEAYDLDGYRFALKPGAYTVRLYLKVGYKPNAKPGVFVIDVDIEGKRVLDGADLLLLGGSDFNRAVVKEFRGVVVADGTLDIKFGFPAGGDRTARLCNAIEVVPEK